MPQHFPFKKIFLIGSGPIVIGQGCEFDYSGVQACKALREEGCKIILLNSNPATIMTDPSMADATYIAPMTLEVCEQIIAKESPDALLPTLGGQTALNLAVALARAGILEKYGVQLIGASIVAIEKAENRKLFREAMQRIGLEVPNAFTVGNFNEILELQNKLVFPIMIRTSFVLGGFGSAIVNNLQELKEECKHLFSLPTIKTLELEEALVGWKEFEMEAIRDRADNCIVVCSLENIDPMGVHTGDSITVAPAQTLCNKEYQRMRQATFAILREIGVDTGGSNVQFAVHPETGRMLVIEMNPRVSRSSALASKATGYPIAKIATKLALGYTLDELENSLTREKIPASFEPSIDYVVTKFPHFDFEKFSNCDGVLTTKMQSTGEVIGIGRNFQESLQKAIISLEKGHAGFSLKSHSKEQLLEKISRPYYDRLFYLAEAFRHGFSVEELYEKTSIDHWFLGQIAELVFLEQSVEKNLTAQSLYLLKRKGFSDKRLAELLGENETFIRKKRHELGIFPVYKRVDTCAAEFSVKSACLYSTYEQECEAEPSLRKKVMIIGSGPNRIGQGLEFDYSSVHAVLASRACGYETIMVNSNPETVSTDYDMVDRLYLEPLTFEHVLNIIEIEKPEGVMTQFGGQTALNLAIELQKTGVRLLGTSAESINICENRDLFQKIVAQLGYAQPKNFCIYTQDNWSQYVSKIQYPVILRPSYLLSGSSMQVIRTPAEYLAYKQALIDRKYFPVLVEQFLEGAIEAEVDGICDGKDVFISGVMEQFEPAGIHSGDSSCCFPAYALTNSVQKKIIQQAKQLALSLGIIGLFNAQFIIKDEEIFIIELNPRASRTVPFLSKALGVSLPEVATRCVLGEKLNDQVHMQSNIPAFFSIKIPVFPFDRLGKVELGPEMKSTGEMMLIVNKENRVNMDFKRFELCSLQKLTKIL